jgi:sec-independent protein translocase protein TatB
MDFLGIGPLELFFILIIALIVLGPNDMVKAGRTLGRFMRKVVTSPTWRTVQDTSRELRNLPYKLMREAGVEELREDLKEPYQNLKQDLRLSKEDLSPWTTPPPVIQPPMVDPEDRSTSESAPPTEESPG